MEKKSKYVVLALIENTEGEFLLSVRNEPEIPEAHLKYDLPGGTNDFGESLEETLHREIAEETGLEAEIIQMFPWSISKIWDHRDYILHSVVFCFHCKLIDDSTSHNSDLEIETLEWVPKDQLQGKEYLETTKFFIDKLLAA